MGPLFAIKGVALASLFKVKLSMGRRPYRAHSDVDNGLVGLILVEKTS